MRRSIVPALFLSVALSVACVGCGSEESASSGKDNGDATAEETVIDADNVVENNVIEKLYVSYPSDWKTEAEDNGNVTIFLDDYGLATFSFVEFNKEDYSEEEYNNWTCRDFINASIESFVNEEDMNKFDDSSSKRFYLGNCYVYQNKIPYVIDGEEYDATLEHIFNDNQVYSILLVMRKDIDKEVSDNLTSGILDSIRIEGDKAPAFPIEPSEDSVTETPVTETKEPVQQDTVEPTKQDASTETVSQQNAVRQAKNYLSIIPFSHDGLIKQLTDFDKFSYDDAAYGVEHCGADWYEQAVKKAQDYLDIMAYSHDGLVNQLVSFDKFTQEEAEYGVSQVGL